MKLNKIYNENCLDTMARMPDDFIDLTVTSPPYDNLRTYNGFDFDWHSVIKSLFRVTKPGGVVVWVVSDATIKGSETGTSFKQALWAKECGFNLHDTMIYEKQNPIPLTHNRYEQKFEYMFVLSKNKPKTFNPIKTTSKNSGRLVSWKRDARSYDNDAVRFRDEYTEIKKEKIIFNIWTYPIGGSYGEANKHPAIFPEQLANDHIISWSNEGDIVYDPFMGSGTTAKMAILNNRKFVGSEISKEYCDIANNRIQQLDTLY